MKYTVEIWKHLIGTVAIEADTAEEALQKAYRRYKQAGMELPDMEDVDNLEFCICNDNQEMGE